MGSPVHIADLQGYGRLAFDATLRTTDLVEAMHATIARKPWPWARLRPDHTDGITGFVYDSVRGVTRTLAEAVDLAWSGALPLLEHVAQPTAPTPAREALLAVVNGVFGDHLEASGNPLAQPMQLRADGHAFNLEPDLDPGALPATFPQAGSKLLVLVHGLCMSDLRWRHAGYSHADALVCEQGYTELRLRYNSGRHISVNGREFADTLEALVRAWPVPVERLTIVGHSMGGLVARSACHYAKQAGHAWPEVLRDLVFLATPHHGAPLERSGNRLQWLVGMTPYTAPLARLGMLRSAGVTDLRHSSLLDEDWNGEDRFARHDDHRRHLPLPDGLRCFALAATLGKQAGDWRDDWLGDGLVPLDSALGRHPDPSRCLDFPPDRQAVFRNTGHLELLARRDVGAMLAGWLAPNEASARVRRGSER